MNSTTDPPCPPPPGPPPAWYPPPGPPPAWYPPPTPAPSRSGFAVTALVLGLVALPFLLVHATVAFAFLLGLIGAGFAIAAVVRLARRRSTAKGLTIASSILVALVMVVAIASTESAAKPTPATGSTTGASDAATPSPRPARSTDSVQPMGQMGAPVRDGKFEFVVSKYACGAKKVGSGFLIAEAQGQFCIVNLTVRNIGNVPQTLFGSNQYLFNAAGQKFEANTAASIYLGNSRSFIEAINPGNQITGQIVFDVPVGTTPTVIELHDSLFSFGVRVNLQ